MEFIDQHPVTSHRIRFQGRTEITEADAEHVKDGNIMVWLVRTRCLPPQYHPTAKEAEERYRFNIQAVEAAQPLTGSMRDAALLRLNHGQPELWADEVQLLDASHMAALSVAEVVGDTMGSLDIATSAEEHAEVVAMRDLLAELGELHEGERLINAVKRVIEQRNPVVVREVGRVEPVSYLDERVSLLPEDVEVVGSIYRQGRKSDLQELLNQEFGRE